MQSRIDRAIAGSLPWLVIEVDDSIGGYAYAAPWKERQAYENTVETTIYLRDGVSGQGLGSRLYSELLEELRSKSLHSALGGIALPNDASVRLHERLGFEKVGQLHQVGFKFDRRIDVGYWQLPLNSE